MFRALRESCRRRVVLCLQVNNLLLLSSEYVQFRHLGRKEDTGRLELVTGQKGSLLYGIVQVVWNVRIAGVVIGRSSVVKDKVEESVGVANSTSKLCLIQVSGSACMNTFFPFSRYQNSYWSYSRVGVF